VLVLSDTKCIADTPEVKEKRMRAIESIKHTGVEKYAAARFMHEKIEGSFLKIIDHAGHLSNLENPDEFNVQLKKFVESVYKDITKVET